MAHQVGISRTLIPFAVLLAISVQNASGIKPNGTWILAHPVHSIVYSRDVFLDSGAASSAVGPRPVTGPSAHNWTYMWAGPGAVVNNATSEYTIIGVASSPTAGPSTRHQIGCTLDPTEDHLWIVGGIGHVDDNKWGTLDQIWSFSLVDKLWTFWHGVDKENVRTNSTSGVLGATVWPFVEFDTTGKLNIFSSIGQFSDYDGVPVPRRDLWSFDPATLSVSFVTSWPLTSTTIISPPFFANSPTNDPNPMVQSGFHKSANGSLYMFGGITDEQLLRFDMEGPTIHQMAILNQETTNSAAVYPDNAPYGSFDSTYKPGPRNAMIGFSSRSDYFALYGGYNNVYGDLWVFNTTTSQWSLFWRNYNIDGIGVGEPNIISSSFTPGAKMLTSGIVDKNGVLWFYGGVNYDGDVGWTAMSDLWAYTNTNCEVGEYFDWTNYICRQCSIDTYTTMINTTTSCLPCPRNSTTDGVEGAWSCVCSVGYYGDPHSLFGCQACPIGTLKSTVGNGNLSDVCVWVPTTTTGRTTTRTTTTVLIVQPNSTNTRTATINDDPATMTVTGNPTAEPTNSSNEESKRGSSTGAYIGIGVGAAGFVLAVSGVATYYVRKHKLGLKQSATKEEKQKEAVPLDTISNMT